MMLISGRLSISGTITQPNSTPNPKIQNPEPDPKSAKLKPSPQLNRWSRARSIRSGRKLERPVGSLEKKTMEIEEDDDEMDGCDVSDEGAKSIYLVSDGTGWTAEHTVTAALEQFDYCLVDRGCRVTTHLFSGIDDVERLMEIIKQAAREGAMVVYTLAESSMAESARQACKLWEVPCTDILSPITEAVANHLGVSPSGLPRGAPGRNSALSEDYFKRIEAIEFTIKQDDGALPQNLHKADIVLTGVSRTGKTPLSIYLAQKGYKVANVPLVMGIKAPKALFEIDPEKIFGLTINPVVLQTIRCARAKTLGFHGEAKSNYSEMDHIRKELEYASTLFAQNPVWPVIEVTGKAIEETAAVILRLYQDRKNRCSMPRISKRY